MTAASDSARGPWAAAGVAIVGARGGQFVPSLRLEVGYPLRPFRLGKLSIVVPLVIGYQRVSLGFAAYTAVTLVPLPGVQLEIDLPIRVPGRLSVFVECGLGVALTMLRVPDAPYTPAHWEVHGVGALRLGAALRYVATMGVVVAVQPLGLVSIMQAGILYVFYEFSATVGYRWR